VVLGEVGANFGAGMTGGMAFIYDESRSFDARANGESIVWQRLSSLHWEAVLKNLITDHAEATDSKWSRGLIEDWDRVRGHFWQVVPKEMLTRLAHPLDDSVEMVAAE
jgi:glutamate synthase (NADPH/NADH) large chain